jgi:transcriptional regulator with XRE-family HTH domain
MGYKQAQMAKLLEMHQGTYNKIENNKINISLDILEKISIIFETTIVEIIEYQKKRNPSDTSITYKLEELIESIKLYESNNNSEHNSLIILTLLKEYSKVLREINLK